MLCTWLPIAMITMRTTTTIKVTISAYSLRSLKSRASATMKPSLRGEANGSSYGRDWTFGHWTEGPYARFRSGLSSSQGLSLTSLHSCGYDLPPPRVGWRRRYHALVKDSWFAGLLSLLGVVAGLCLWVLTIAISRGNISGNGWSLSGNGALVVPFGLGPALVA